jgi:hypothetical protein
VNKKWQFMRRSSYPIRLISWQVIKETNKKRNYILGLCLQNAGDYFVAGGNIAK